MQEITVVVPSFNHSRYIAGAIGSVIRQSIFDQVMLIVSDDCSTDDTFERAGAAASGHTNILIRRNEMNLGVMKHYRRLMELVNTEFVAVLEGDDEWINPDKLASQLATLRAPSTALCFTACIVKDEASGKSWKQPPWNDGRDKIVELADLIRQNDISTFSNCAYRSRAFREALAQDRAMLGYDWLCNLIVGSAGEIAFIAEVSTEYRVHANGAWARLSAEDRARRIERTLLMFRDLAAPNLVPLVDEALQRARAVH